jgi:hypothetical protein
VPRCILGHGFSGDLRTMCALGGERGTKVDFAVDAEWRNASRLQMLRRGTKDVCAFDRIHDVKWHAEKCMCALTALG